MAAPVKNFIDLDEITKEWKNIEGVKGQYHLKNLKLSVTGVEWTNVTCLSDPNVPQRSQATAVYDTKQNERYAKIKAQVKSQTGTHVTIDNGAVKGLHRNFKLPLAGLPVNIINATGDFLEIDVGEAETDRNAQTQEYFAKFTHTIDRTDGPSVAQAVIERRTGDYIAYFSGTARLEGEVICQDDRAVTQENIREVVCCLQKPKPKHVDKLCVTGNGLTVDWKIGGYCHFFLGTNVDVAWR